MLKKELIIDSVNPKELSENELREIAEVEKDMWAYGIGEYVKCDCCQDIYSKHDIFWHLSDEIRLKSVTKLEEIFLWDSIKCKKCNTDMDFIYDLESNIFDIKSRLHDSMDSYISLLKDEFWTINWFIDGYIDDFSWIYDRELKSHYWNIWKDLLIRNIERKLWEKLPEKIFSFSSMGTIEQYKSFYIIFELIKDFFANIHKENDHILWLTELDSWKSLNAIYHSMWAVKVWLENNKLITNKSSNYNSDIYIHRKVVKDYKENFSLPIKQFLRKNKWSMRDILVA